MHKIIFRIQIVFIGLLAATLLGCTKKSTEPVAGKISGVVTISQELAATLKPTDVLYIIVRQQQMGPPTAVKRIERPQFPLNYVVGPEDAMMPSQGGFDDKTPVTVAARISRTGNAMPAVGDLEGVYGKNPARPGTGGVDIMIDRERK
ncbi:MAG: hypothetical protein AB1540_09370 [Bdellovibrionota bacterium]